MAPTSRPQAFDDGVEECVREALRHSLKRLLEAVEAGEEWSSWVASHQPEATVIAWGFAIDPEAIEAAIDRAAKLLPFEGTRAIGVIGGIYSAAGARLRAGRPLDPTTVGVLRDFAAAHGA